MVSSLYAPRAHVAFALQQREACAVRVRVAGFGHQRGRRARRQKRRAIGRGRGKRDLSGHDQTAGLLPAFSQALLENQLIGALTENFGHGADIAAHGAAGNGGFSEAEYFLRLPAVSPGSCSSIGTI